MTAHSRRSAGSESSASCGYVSWAVANWRVALLAVAGFTFLGLQGLWQESMDTLALTLSAVLVALLFALPLGVWAGLSERANRIVTPFLDFMQTMPTFVYLAPLTLFFLIGGASATIATVIYAAPLLPSASRRTPSVPCPRRRSRPPPPWAPPADSRC